MNHHLIIGAGEVGRGLYEFLVPIDGITVELRDVDAGNISGVYDVLHICFPYSDQFCRSIRDYDNEYAPNLIVVYSTVPVGTVKTLGARVVHSPVEGVHPDLWKAFSVFTRIIGVNSQEDYKNVRKYLDPIFKQFYWFYDTDKTELMKLLSTGYRYPTYIALAQEQERICRSFGFDYKEIVTTYDSLYNQGYRELGVTAERPLAYPGAIGGHCIKPNMEMLRNSGVGNNDVHAWIEKSDAKKRKELK